MTVVDRNKIDITYTEDNKNISEQLQSKLDKLAQQGNQYYDNENNKEKALEVWKKALELIPEPKNVYSQTVWFLSSIGDIYFSDKNYEQAFKCFEDAKNNISGEGTNNPFILLRLGESAYELDKKELAIENLLSAYMLEGKEIFNEDDKKYFEFLKANVDLDSKN